MLSVRDLVGNFPDKDVLLRRVAQRPEIAGIRSVWCVGRPTVAWYPELSGILSAGLQAAAIGDASSEKLRQCDQVDR
jgi:hypothetical protein